MTETLLRFQESSPFHRPGGIAALCIILWTLAHVFGVLTIVFFNAALYEKDDRTSQNQPTSPSLPSSTPMKITFSDAATHKSLDWGLAAGAMSLLLIITGFGMWRKKKWFIIPLVVLILALLPAILSTLGLNLNLFK